MSTGVGAQGCLQGWAHRGVYRGGRTGVSTGVSKQVILRIVARTPLCNTVRVQHKQKPKLSFVGRLGAIEELRALVPEAQVTASHRLVTISFTTSKKLRLFLTALLEDEDLVAFARTVHMTWGFERDDDGEVHMLLHAGFNAHHLDTLLRQLRQVTAADIAAATAAESAAVPASTARTRKRTGR